MRVTPWRSLIRLSLPLMLALGACTPQLDLRNRPPPCEAGFEVCPTTGTCVSPAELKDDAVCRYSFAVRQGWNDNIPVPGFAPADVRAVASIPGVSTKVLPAPGGAIVNVDVPHGTPPTGGDATVVITTTSNGVSTKRQVPLIVSQIGVSPDGDDLTTVGTMEHPFRSLAKASYVAETGDTIRIRHASDVMSNGDPFTDGDPNAALIKPGVTIEGVDLNVVAPGKVVLLGDASIDTVRLLQRFVITEPSSHVKLHDIMAINGVTMADSAMGTELYVSGEHTEIRSDDGGDSALSVHAVGATVTIATQAKITQTGTANGLAAVSLAGSGQRFTMLDSFVTIPNGAITSVNLAGATTVNIQRSDVTGRIDVTASGADATIVNTTLRGSQGGGVLFRGATMMMVGCLLVDGVPIEQDGAGSQVTVSNTEFHNYTAYAYRLMNGHLDLGDEVASGNDKFIKSPTSGTGAALDIEEPPGVFNGVTNGVTVRGATFDMQAQPLPGFSVTGPTPPPANSIYFIADGVTIQFL